MSDLTVSQAAARLGISERTVQRRCKRGTLTARLETTPDGTQWLIDGATLPTGDDTTADKVTTGNQAHLETFQDRTADTAANVPTGADTELLDHLRGENAFLRGLVEQRDRDAAELRAALRKALEAMPKAITDGGKLEQVGTEKRDPPQSPETPEITPDGQTTSQAKPSAQRATETRKLTAWQRIAGRVLGIR